MKRLRHSFWAIFIVLTFCFTTQTLAVDNYIVYDLGKLPSGAAQDINSSTQVVGQMDLGSFEYRGYIWDENTGFTDLGTLSTTSRGMGINDAGKVVGQDGSGSSARPFLWENGTMTSLGTLPGFIRSSQALAINNTDEIVGYCNGDNNLPPTTSRGFFWNGSMNELATLGGSTGSAQDINDSGQIVGGSKTAASSTDHACFWDSYTATPTDLTPTGYGFAYGINSTGEVVGVSGLSPYNAFYWSGSGAIQLLNMTGYSFSWARDINDSDIIVGNALASGGQYHAVLWEGVSTITNLNNQLAPGSGWVLEQAYAINNAGQIVGYGDYNTDNYHGYILTPIPPGSPTLTLVVNGLGTVTRNPHGDQYPAGTVIEFSATPDPGLAVVWENTDNDDSREHTNTVTMPGTDLTVTVNFVQMHDVSYYHNGLGYIDASPASDEYPEGTTVTLTAVAEPGWQFDGWTGDVTGMQNPANLLVDNVKNVQANFVIIGDVDASGKVDVADCVPALQAAIGITPASGNHVGADVNGNGQIGLAEAAHAFQTDARLRPFQTPATAGEYYNVGMEYDFDPFDEGPTSWMSLIELDGWGLLTATDLYVSNPPLDPPGTAAYFPNPEGSITISVNDGIDTYQFHGFSAADTSHYVIANTTPLPGLDYGIKKSVGLSNAILNGTYVMAEFKYEADPFIVPVAIFNNVTFNGISSGTSQETMSSDGNLDTEVVSFNYSVAADGKLTVWVTPPGEPTIYFYGAVKDDGSTFSLLQNYPPFDVGMMVGVKKSTGAGNSLINGEYIYAGMQHDTDPLIWDVYTSRGLLTVDGAGNGIQRNLTENGSVYPAESLFTYSVGSDGTFTIDTGEGTVDGIVSPDGETILFGFMEQTRPGIAVGIKKSP